MKEFVYLDNAATTKVRPEVVEAMLPYFTEILWQCICRLCILDRSASRRVARCQRDRSQSPPSEPRLQEIYFTAGGSESDNWALKATAEAYKDKGKHIITSKIEHHAILHTCALSGTAGL